MSCQSCADLQPFRLSVSSQYRFEALLLSVHAFQHFLCQLTSGSPESTGTRFSLLFWSFWKCSQSSDMCQTFCKQCKTTGTGNHLISPKSPSASVLFAVFFKTNLDFTVNVKKQAAWLFFFCFCLIQIIPYLCRGYGFVKFTDELEQKRALTECQGAVGLGSKPVRLSVAIPKAWV